MSAVFLIGDLIVVWVPVDATVADTEFKIYRGAEVPEPVRTTIDAGCTFVAHNADGFDRPAWDRFGYGCPDWVDTIHACRANGLPAGLDKASKALGGEGKDDKGSRAMMLLTRAKVVGGNVVYPKGTPEVWSQMLRYNVADVLELKRIFDAVGVPEQDLLRVHRRINDRGIPVDVPLARRLRDLWTELGIKARDEVAELTGGRLTADDVASVPKVRKWLAHLGCPVESLARAKVEAMIADPESVFAGVDDERSALALRVLSLRNDAVRTAPGKLDRVLGSAVGGRVRNCFVYHGAHTGRWSARDLQPHNFPRGLAGLDVGHLLHVWDTAGGRLDLQMVRARAEQAGGGSTADALATLMRPVIRAPRGKRLCIVDYAGVEARCVAWLARDDRMLAAFDRDIYLDMASAIFGRECTKKDKDERQLGKIAILGLGYQMGKAKFALSAKLGGANLERAGVSADQVVKTFRSTYPGVPMLWRAYDRAFRNAIDGIESTAGRCEFKRRGDDVLIVLPSGRALTYRNARMEPIIPVWGGEPIPSPCYTSHHGFRRSLYGGILTENISQATCRDLLASAMIELDRQGGKIVMHVHDECVIEADHYEALFTLRRMMLVMSTPPQWADGFPLAVEGYVGEHYTKAPLPGSAHGAAKLGVVTEFHE